jgi:hypothetical protein
MPFQRKLGGPQFIPDTLRREISVTARNQIRSFKSVISYVIDLNIPLSHSTYKNVIITYCKCTLICLLE